MNRESEPSIEQLQARIEHLELAVQSGRRVGVAIGIVMATELLTLDQAFERLRVVSQSSNRKMRDIADQVTMTGRL